MRRADRLLNIIQILRRYKRPISGDIIAQELEVSLRTIYRDIQTLITDGVPIRGEAGIGYILGEGYDLPPMIFKTEELEALMLGLRWVMQRTDKELRIAAIDAVTKIGTVLPKDIKPYLYDASLLVPPSFSNLEYKVCFSEIRKALRQNQKVKITYTREDGLATERIIWPFAISYFESKSLLIGFCELRNESRAFRIDRISKLETLSEKYKERRRKLIRDWVKSQTCNPSGEISDVFL